MTGLRTSGKAAEGVYYTHHGVCEWCTLESLQLIFRALHSCCPVSVIFSPPTPAPNGHSVSLTLSQLASSFHNSENSSTSSQTLVSYPGFILLSNFPLYHYLSLLFVSNRTASIIIIDFYTQSILVSEVKAGKSSQMCPY